MWRWTFKGGASGCGGLGIDDREKRFTQKLFVFKWVYRLFSLQLNLVIFYEKPVYYCIFEFMHHMNGLSLFGHFLFI